MERLIGTEVPCFDEILRARLVIHFLLLRSSWVSFMAQKCACLALACGRVRSW